LESSEKYIKQLINPKQFDIILFEYLESIEGITFAKNLIEYWTQSEQIKDNFPILGLAHFDPSYFIHGALDALIDFLREFNIYFEFNSRYSEFFSRKYELFFEQLREFNIPIAIGSDAHTLRRLDDLEEPLQMVDYLNLKANSSYLIERLKK
jgi:histidinol phosphatase-like PHP family hydrolase